jgi:hypothetical protein
MRNRTHRKEFPGTIALLGIMISCLLGCGDTGAPRPQQSSASAEVEAAMVRGAASNAKGSEADVRKAFAVMETAPEPMPLHLRSRAKETIGGGTRLGLRFDRAQRLMTTIGSAWMVGGSKGILCLLMEDAASSSCGLASDAIESGKVLEIYKSIPPHGRMHDFRLVGIAPNWARAVRIRIGKKKLMIRVSGNAFGYRAEDPIRVVDFIR